MSATDDPPAGPSFPSRRWTENRGCRQVRRPSRESVQARLPRGITRYLAEAEGAYAARTLEALAGDFRGFQAWCRRAGRRPFPAEASALAAYLGELERRGYRPATLQRQLASLSHLHRACGHQDPTKARIVGLTLRRAQRRQGVRPRRPLPLDRGLVAQMLAGLGDTACDRRDRALLLVARDSLCRRSELAALRREDLAAGGDGAGSILVRRHKADPLGEGRVAWLAPETMAALAAWLKVSGTMAGPLFQATVNGRGPGAEMTPQGLARRFKALAQRAGLDATRISCRSTRIGAAIELVASGASLIEVQLAGGWASPRMPARYAQDLLPALGAVARLHSRLQSQSAAAPQRPPIEEARTRSGRGASCTPDAPASPACALPTRPRG